MMHLWEFENLWSSNSKFKSVTVGNNLEVWFFFFHFPVSSCWLHIPVFLVFTSVHPLITKFHDFMSYMLDVTPGECTQGSPAVPVKAAVQSWGCYCEMPLGTTLFILFPHLSTLCWFDRAQRGGNNLDKMLSFHCLRLKLPLRLGQVGPSCGTSLARWQPGNVPY